MGTDYHTKPNANVRVDAGNLAWARGEAKRRGQQFGDFMDGLIAAERDKVAGHVVDLPPVAAGDEHPQQAGKSCAHRNMRISKGICPDCHQPVGYREGQQ
jgi:hypothetical protein